MKVIYHQNYDSAMAQAIDWQTKGDYLVSETYACNCLVRVPAIRLRDAHIGKVRAIFAICPTCAKTTKTS